MYERSIKVVPVIKEEELQMLITPLIETIKTRFTMMRIGAALFLQPIGEHLLVLLQQ
jgi:hypothetical protein